MSRSERKPLYLLLVLSLTPASPRPAAAAPLPSSPEVIRWCQAYAPAVHPLHAALDEALDALGHGWGPDSHGLGYPLHEALLPVAALLPVPDPLLDRRLRQALGSLESGADACMKSMPMTTRLRLVDGGRALADLESALAAVSPACVPGWSGRAKLTLVVGVEGEGMTLADNPVRSGVPSGRRAPRGAKRQPAAHAKPHRSGAE